MGSISSMSQRQYMYRDFVKRTIAALNEKDWDMLFDKNDYSSRFIKHLGPQSMDWPPQSREEWRADLTSGFVGEMYLEWHIVIQAYWEDAEKRSAIAWLRETGLFVEDQKYEQDYVMRYEFDGDGKLLNLWELTDSYLQKTLAEKWERRVAARKARKTEGEGLRPV